MLDRHELNHIFLNDEGGIYDAVYDHFAEDYPELKEFLGRDERNKTAKTVVHDFADCWAVDWWDDLEALRRFEVAFNLSDQEITDAFVKLYGRAEKEGWPRSVMLHAKKPKKIKREEENPDFLNCPIELMRKEGEPVYGCYAHDVCWQILGDWLDEAIRKYGSCEQEAKWALCNLVDSCLESQYQLERNSLLFGALILLPYLIGMPLLIWLMPGGKLVPLFVYACMVLYLSPRLIGRIRAFMLVAKRKFYVNPEDVTLPEGEDDLPLPEAVKYVRDEKGGEE